jgi:hypothetical protein
VSGAPEKHVPGVPGLWRAIFLRTGKSDRPFQLRYWGLDTPLARGGFDRHEKDHGRAAALLTLFVSRLLSAEIDRGAATTS